ncbi:MAG: hypothetical protein K6T51_13640 [Rubrobacteraceae bacterium]|uniref:hypothetical protein n=1 Tax=Rubrobacter naiadicus TaxID=1392641 RepID=UPI00235F209B|nr:hypothetical protein [Rubrobacter naiadicus]MBX6764126.1 hypothetical protein [Rubrobacteraceae bacterium]MCL6439645.1 hypothetical protein [Rubrobacteraceae bacterium]
MRALLRELVGLVADDGRLVWTVVLALVVSAVLGWFGLKEVATVVLWAGILFALALSIESRIKLQKKDR